MAYEISRFQASVETAFAYIANMATPERRKATKEDLIGIVAHQIYARFMLEDRYRRLTGKKHKVSEKFGHRSSAVMPKAAYAKILHEVSLDVFKTSSQAELIGMLTGKVARPCEWKQEDVIGYWVIVVGGYEGKDPEELSSEQIAKNQQDLEAYLVSRISA